MEDKMLSLFDVLGWFLIALPVIATLVAVWRIGGWELLLWVLGTEVAVFACLFGGLYLLNM